MAAHTIGDLNSLIVKKGPWRNPYYFSKRAFAPGVTPKHLESHAAAFATAARDCKGTVSGLKGKEHVEALRACIGQKLKR